MKLNGIDLDIDKELLKRHIRKEETIKIFDYEENEGIIDQAISMLEKVRDKRGLFAKVGNTLTNSERNQKNF